MALDIIEARAFAVRFRPGVARPVEGKVLGRTRGGGLKGRPPGQKKERLQLKRGVSRVVRVCHRGGLGKREAARFAHLVADHAILYKKARRRDAGGI